MVVVTVHRGQSLLSKVIHYGPYPKFEGATEVLAEHLQDFLLVEFNGYLPEKYVARIDEICRVHGDWHTIATKIEDHYGEII
jgi:hypothetical protein